MRTIVLQIWDCHLLEKLKYLLHKSLVKKSALWANPTSILQFRHEADTCLCSISLISYHGHNRLDWNSISGSVPSKLNNLTSLNELYLSNNNLNGSIPDLTGMNLLSYVGMSNNNFNASAIPQLFTSLPLLKIMYFSLVFLM
ncbi:hypothetical protein BC332_15960 [Capsicum chinense]|nr:hypothetical protein BC332_15960 [Capsicum chinense]